MSDQKSIWSKQLPFTMLSDTGLRSTSLASISASSARPGQLYQLGIWGYLDQALQRSQETLALAETLGHPFSQALAMAYAAMVFQFSRDDRLVEQWAQATIALSAEQGTGYYDSWATILYGWARAEQGSPAEGIDHMHKGLDDFRKMNVEARFPYYLTLLAEAYSIAGQTQEGLKRLRQAVDLAEKNSDNWYQAETYRLMGELTLRSGDAGAGEDYFHQALDISRRQKARTLELRATVSLARLWQQQSKQEKAHTLLVDIFNWFTEGFDTVDLKAARELMDELS